MRFLDWGVRRCPFFVEPLLVASYASIFYVVAWRQRRAVVANLEVLVPSAGWVGRRVRAMRVFWEFAWMLVDAARARLGERHVTWRLDGAEVFQAAVAESGGALLLTAHMGNYDVAGPFFADKFGRTVHGVRRPERRADLQAYMEEQRDARSGDGYRIQYNVAGGFLGLELARALAAGDVVAIQGDRVGKGMGEVAVEWRGRVWRLPSGPLVLAQVAGVSIFPVFTIRDGWRSYRVLFLPPRAPDPPPTQRADRPARLRSMTLWWAGTLAGVLGRHWSRWLMFEHAFDPLSVGSGAIDRLPVAPQAVDGQSAKQEASGSPGMVAADAGGVLPPRKTPARPESRLSVGWRPVLQPISRTALGRTINALGWLLPAESPHQLRAEDSAQNWVEVTLLAGFSGLLAAAAVWEGLAAMLPKWVVPAVLPVAWFLWLHVVPSGCALVAEAVTRVAGAPSRMRIGRVTEELLLGVQSLLALWLLTTRFWWLGGAWLAFAALNGLCFLILIVVRGGTPGEGR